MADGSMLSQALKPSANARTVSIERSIRREFEGIEEVSVVGTRTHQPFGCKPYGSGSEAMVRGCTQVPMDSTSRRVSWLIKV